MGRGLTAPRSGRPKRRSSGSPEARRAAREECAKVCDAYAERCKKTVKLHTLSPQMVEECMWAAQGAEDCGADIRALPDAGAPSEEGT